MTTSERAAAIASRANAGRLANVRTGRTAVVWVAVLVLFSCLSPAFAEVDAECSRCGKWLKLSDEGAGFWRDWEGLCGDCQDPAKRCDDAVKDLERRIEEARDRLGYFRTKQGHAQNAAAGSESDRRQYKAQEGVTPEEDIGFYASQIAHEEAVVAALLARLERMKAECSGAAPGGAPAGGSAPGSGPGGSRGPADAVRDLRLQVERMNDLAKRLSDQMKALEDQLGPTGALSSDSAPIEASHMDQIHRYIEPLVDSARTESPAAAASEATSAESEGAPTVSQEAVIKPALADAGKSLPNTAVAQKFTLWRRQTANATAYSQALRESLAQADAAKGAGDLKRAHTHLERAVYLASAGQKELRAAEGARTEAVRELYNDSKSFEELAKGNGKTVEEAFASWQTQVRADGLSAAYLANLQEAGLSKQQITKYREWVQGVDSKKAGETHARFMNSVAPRYLPEARGKKPTAKPLPAADELWDLVSITLLRAAHPAK